MTPYERAIRKAVADLDRVYDILHEPPTPMVRCHDCGTYIPDEDALCRNCDENGDLLCGECYDKDCTYGGGRVHCEDCDELVSWREAYSHDGVCDACAADYQSVIDSDRENYARMRTANMKGAA